MIAAGPWYHATSWAAAREILREGVLRAPAELAEHYRGRGEKSFAPVAGLIYLTNDLNLAFTYARMRAKGKREPFGVVFEVAPEGPCQADEDDVGGILREYAERVTPHSAWTYTKQEGDDEPARAREIAAKHADEERLFRSLPRALQKRVLAQKRWYSTTKARLGKVALEQMPPAMRAELTARLRSIGCRGARILRAWVIGPSYYVARNEAHDRLRRAEGGVAATTREHTERYNRAAREALAEYHELDVHAPLPERSAIDPWGGAPVRLENPAPRPATHHHIWSCPSGPANIVFFLRDHYETESEERILRAGGGWRTVAGDVYAGGWRTKQDFVKDFAVGWYRVKNPDGGEPLYVIVSSGIENVFAPHGVDVDDLMRWADAWEENEG